MPLVQTAARVEGGYPSASISFSTTPTVGNLLIAYINFGPNYGGTITGATVSDNQGNSWATADISILNNGAGAICYCVPTTASGTFTVTVQPTVSGTSDAAVGVAMQEWSGMSATPFDRSGTSNAISGSPYSVTASGANATADSLVCALLTARSTITAIDNSPPTGYTNVFASLTSGATEPAVGSYKVVSSSETSSADWGVVANGSDGTAVVATFSAAAAGTTHAGTGAGPGSGATATGASARTRAHPSTGAAAGAGGAGTGAASRTRVHAAAGAAQGAGGVANGTAARTRAHAASGTAAGAGGAVDATASRTRLHASSGAAEGQGATATGSGARVGAPPNHVATGAGVGAGATAAGSALRYRVHTSSGAIVGGGAVVDGAAQIVIPAHVATGVAAGGGGAVSGSASRSRAHAASCIAAGGGAQADGSASRIAAPVTHEASGVATGGGGAAVASASVAPQFTRAPAGAGYSKSVFNTARPASTSTSRSRTTNTRR